MDGKDDRTRKPDADPRRARLAEALRENLRRRKDQARARATPAPSLPVPDGTDGNKT
jgi:hypothetical protein